MSKFVLANGKWIIDKDPNARLQYGIELADWLGTDSLAAVTATATGCTAETATISGTKVLAWVSGGAVGEAASVTFRFTTAGGSVDDRTLHFNIVER